MSPLLRVLQNEVQLAALSFLGVFYTLKLIWLFRFPSGSERTFPAGSARAGVAISLFNVMMPWQMESTRRNPLFHLQFVVFHLGVATAILVSFVIPYGPHLLEHRGVVPVFLAILGAALLVGLARLARRLREPALRRISTVDDYLSLALTILFFATGMLAVSGRSEGPEWLRIQFFALTALFLVYVPFSKICHYLYYPFTRFFLGRTLGHRGVLPPARRERT